MWWCAVCPWNSVPRTAIGRPRCARCSYWGAAGPVAPREPRSLRRRRGRQPPRGGGWGDRAAAASTSRSGHPHPGTRRGASVRSAPRRQARTRPPAPRCGRRPTAAPPETPAVQCARPPGSYGTSSRVPRSRSVSAYRSRAGEVIPFSSTWAHALPVALILDRAPAAAGLPTFQRNGRHRAIAPVDREDVPAAAASDRPGLPHTWTEVSS